MVDVIKVTEIVLVVDTARVTKVTRVLGVLSNYTAAMERNLSFPETDILQVYT